MLYLASTSPRRRALLEEAGIPFRLAAPGVEPDRPGDPAAVARERARAKARSPEALPDAALVLAVDTVVDLDGVELGKPASREVAARMLTDLSSGRRRHLVHTAHCLRWPARDLEWEEAAVAGVEFEPLDEAALSAYLATGEWSDKAGAYGIQGAAGAFARLVHGDLDTVIGLSLRSVRALLARREEVA